MISNDVYFKTEDGNYQKLEPIKDISSLDIDTGTEEVKFNNMEFTGTLEGDFKFIKELFPEKPPRKIYVRKIARNMCRKFIKDGRWYGQQFKDLWNWWRSDEKE